MYNSIVFIYILAMFIVAASQILLKKSANKVYSSKLKEYLNPYVLTAYFFITLSMVTTVVAYKYIPLSLGRVLESTAYIFVTILGVIILKEKMNLRKIIGIVIIVMGIIVFSL